MNLADMDPAKLSFILDKDYGICTRAGLHCSPAAHSVLGTNYRGAVRFSPGYFNTEKDIMDAVEAIQRIAYSAAT